MVFFILRFVICWVIWFIFADKKRWREMFPVSIFAIFLDKMADDINSYYKLWEYEGTLPLIPHLLEDLGIYMVCVYLFLQWLPRQKTAVKMMAYWLAWGLICIGVEWIHLATHHMRYFKWWTMGYSFSSDLVLFWLFYQFHKVFNLKILSQKKTSLESAIESLNEVVFILNNQGCIAQVYGCWFEKHNISPEFYIGKGVQEVVGEARKDIIDRLNDRVFKGEHDVVVWQHQLPNSRQYCIFQTTASPLKGKNGEIIGAIGISHELKCGLVNLPKKSIAMDR
jgi:hypothetical protein